MTITTLHHVTPTRKACTITALTLVAACCLLSANNAVALTAPAAGSFLYDIYDIVVVNILQGAGGFAGGVAVMVVAAVLMVRQLILPGVLALVGGALLLRADTIVTSLGAVIC